MGFILQGWLLALSSGPSERSCGAMVGMVDSHLTRGLVSGRELMWVSGWRSSGRPLESLIPMLSRGKPEQKLVAREKGNI